MARKRRLKAFLSFGLALFMVVQGNSILRSRLKSDLYALMLSITIGGTSIFVGNRYWKRANQAAQGAKAEEIVGETLNQLRAYAWTIEHDIPIRYWGNVDHLAISPSGIYFCIDTKSGGGTVVLQGNELSKRYGKKIYPFSQGKNILKAVRGQASQLQENSMADWVNPVLCFVGHQVDPSILNTPVNGVFLTDAHSIARILQSMG
ncbi:NERD domain-containing protein (plasmid) [Acaryochloris sp. 'Moss Beach']|uniref:nuclease-related domain-containing protein n=1 Tax=Acaryochloris sp. 'Moss Beach' TaxID=2740837 RepID=UPI001F1E84D4|nr:nuclease-related domain-containing protein [Acaryochloris sp. 'Moss Beach']UJB73120.1 NERD domain-containing protein [Acaryochloris sp. 'Moss Beach']